MYQLDIKSGIDLSGIRTNHLWIKWPSLYRWSYEVRLDWLMENYGGNSTQVLPKVIMLYAVDKNSPLGKIQFRTVINGLYTSIFNRSKLAVYLRGLNSMTSTEECSSMNLSHVSFVRKCTLPGSLLQSGGGGGGAGFCGLEHRQTETKLGPELICTNTTFKYWCIIYVLHNPTIFWLSLVDFFTTATKGTITDMSKRNNLEFFRELFKSLLLTLSWKPTCLRLSFSSCT